MKVWPRNSVEYLAIKFDPFEGDRDTVIKCQTVKIVAPRQEQECWMGLGRDSTPHKIKIGENCRFEKALVDGEWCSYYVCLKCIEKWLKQVRIL